MSKRFNLPLESIAYLWIIVRPLYRKKKVRPQPCTQKKLIPLQFAISIVTQRVIPFPVHRTHSVHFKLSFLTQAYATKPGPRSYDKINWISFFIFAPTSFILTITIPLSSCFSRPRFQGMHEPRESPLNSPCTQQLSIPTELLLERIPNFQFVCNRYMHGKNTNGSSEGKRETGTDAKWKDARTIVHMVSRFNQFCQTVPN